jgi:hypothetical protein
MCCDGCILFLGEKYEIRSQLKSEFKYHTIDQQTMKARGQADGTKKAAPERQPEK